MSKLKKIIKKEKRARVAERVVKRFFLLIPVIFLMLVTHVKIHANSFHKKD